MLESHRVFQHLSIGLCSKKTFFPEKKRNWVSAEVSSSFNCTEEAVKEEWRCDCHIGKSSQRWEHAKQWEDFGDRFNQILSLSQLLSISGISPDHDDFIQRHCKKNSISKNQCHLFRFLHLRTDTLGEQQKKRRGLESKGVY